MGNVSVTTNAGTDTFGLSGIITIDSLDKNDVAKTTGSASGERLDWTIAFDFDGDGTPDLLDPDAFTCTKDLTIDLDALTQFSINGTITGTGQVGEPDEGTNNPTDNALLSVGDVKLLGATPFNVDRKTTVLNDLSEGTAETFTMTGEVSSLHRRRLFTGQRDRTVIHQG